MFQEILGSKFHFGFETFFFNEGVGRKRRRQNSNRIGESSRSRNLGTALSPGVCRVDPSWRMIIPNTYKVPQISIKRRRRHGVVGVRRLELTERVRRVAHLRNLLEPAAGGRGVAETAGESTRATSSTVNRRAGWPPCGAHVSCTTFPCALQCPAWRLADVCDACHRPRVQEMVSEASWHLFF